MSFEVQSERKEDDASSGRSDALLSADQSSNKQESHVSNDQPSDAHSSYTGFSKQTTVTVLTSRTSPGCFRSQGDIQSKRRNKPKVAPRTTPRKFNKPKSSLPPLDFGSAGLVGRDKELATLKSCSDRLMKDRKKELILVGGQSGSGKSSIIRSMENDIPVEGLFVEGKFDMNTSNEPYSGVATAFGVICQKIKEAGPETVADLRQDLRNELGDKPGMLVHLIPDIQDIMVVETSDDSTDGSIDRVDETEGGVDRLRFAFRALARVFSAFFSPLVLFLDDLQWADVSSLLVLEYLVSDSENENPLMIIGSYRTEEVNENSLLHNKIVGLREKTDKFHFHMTELMIESFSINSIETVITAVLPSLRADHIVGLAALCHKRTLGNPFFTIEFLKMLHIEGMMAFDETTKTWSWNLSEIKKETMSTANVVVMLEESLRKLPEQVQALLQCAAHLGSTFSEPTIDLVWSVYGRRLVETKTEPVSSLLPLLVADDIFEKSENQQYRWAHDKLQEAALSLSGELRDTFCLDIGKILYYGLAEEHVEQDLFTIVDLINNGNASKRPEFAAANLRAAEKARGTSAFQAASEYASEGISLLQDTDWVQNKTVTLNLYTIAAEAELTLGNVAAAERYREAVLSRSDLSTIEMLPLQVGKAKALGDVEVKPKEALEYCLSLLKNHGCRMTWVRPLALPQAVASFIRAVKKAKAKPQKFYEEMKPSDDKQLKYIGYLLSKAAYNAYMAGDDAMYLLSTVKLVDITMEYGVNEFSATAFAFLGVISSTVLQDYEAMERFVNISLGMLKKFRGMHAAESIFVGHQLGLYWVKPLEMGRVVAEKAILEGRREGDFVYTSWSMLQHVVYLPYITGRPIHKILEGCPDILAEFEETKAGAHILSTKNYYQMLLNLSDPLCENPSVHVGKIYSDTKEDHRGNPVHLADKVIAEGELVFWNEDYEVSAKRALTVGEAHAKTNPGVYLNQIESFHRAVALYAAAIKTKKGKYKRAANKIRKRMASLARYDNTTIQYYDLFLTAEHLASGKKPREARTKYEQSLEAVGKLGHLHHLGLLNERYSDFLQRQLSLEKESRYRLEQAIGYYREWGAVHKVKSLESRLKLSKS
ncbi:unnamed protein product [Cylindrotheca closterium]|uniref:Orc1-like AAA ATPase domain-containing protein n=1 Tax=Cylindrotheca closterium TaxID=2856 RepID=A0AAD2FVE4_9STRA|nr:unnamed protein product [Cylindrotheca closterium]